MHKYLFLLSVLFLDNLGLAVQFTIENPCSDSPWLDTHINTMSNQSVGDLTLKILAAEKIPFVGSESGVLSLRELPNSEQKLELISSKDMRAYGWCYSLNGKVPTDFPDKIKIESNEDRIVWFFAYAEYLDGQWRAYCIPTHQTRPSFICKK